jgi:hypothetical protein
MERRESFERSYGAPARIAAQPMARSCDPTMPFEHWDGHHPALCWVTIFTMANLFESMRFSNVTVERIACVSEGAPRCETILRYAR